MPSFAILFLQVRAGSYAGSSLTGMMPKAIAPIIMRSVYRIGQMREWVIRAAFGGKG
jgi:hypothetical protein